MSTEFNFGEPPYDWDEFERFVRWWAGPSLTDDLIPESELDSTLPLELRRWLHLWGKREEMQGRWHRYWVPRPEHYLPSGLIICGQETEGDGRLLAVSPLNNSGLVQWGEYGDPYQSYQDDEEWNVAYSSVNEMLVKTTMLNLAWSSEAFSYSDGIGAKMLLEITPEGHSRPHFVYHRDNHLLVQIEQSEFMLVQRPSPRTDSTT